MLLRIAVVAGAIGATAGLATAGGGTLAPPASDRFYQNVEWSPDGEWIAYSEFAGGEYAPEKWSVWVARRDGSQARLVAPNAIWVTWSPDGKQLAFSSSRNGNPDIYLADTDGANVIRVTDGPGRDTAPAWSPDGAHIAYTSDSRGDADIYVMTPAGKETRRLTEGPLHEHNPAWSHDGDHLVFYRSSGDGNDQVAVREAFGPREWSVTDDDNNNIFPCFLADGSVAFSSRPPDGTPRLVTADIDGKNRQPVGGEEAFFARWSPDGGTIAFVAGNWPQAAIYVMRFDGVGTTKIIN